MYFLGDEDAVSALSPTVQYVYVPARLPTPAGLSGPGRIHGTDLAGANDTLARWLTVHDVLHMTHMFALSRTAARVARERSVPLVASVHTNVPVIAQAYLNTWVSRLSCGPADGALSRTLAICAGAPLQWVQRQLLEHADVLLVANERDRDALSGQMDAPVHLLRRGIDRNVFRPLPPDRGWLRHRFGVRPETQLVLFVGRVDDSKGITTAVEAVASLVEAGRDLTLPCAGRGDQERYVADLLGAHAVLVGSLTQPELAHVYAAADLMCFPSLSETIGNVVGEAMGCGLPVVVPSPAATTRWLRRPGLDGVCVERADTTAWATTVATLLDDESRRGQLAAEALRTSRRAHPSWETVVHEDLMPLGRSLRERNASRTPYLDEPRPCRRAEGSRHCRGFPRRREDD